MNPAPAAAARKTVGEGWDDRVPGRIGSPSELRGFRFVGRALFGANPWPSTGRAGSIASAVMATTALGFLLPLGLALAWGYPTLVGTDFVAYFTAAAMVVQGQGGRLYEAD